MCEYTCQNEAKKISRYEFSIIVIKKHKIKVYEL